MAKDYDIQNEFGETDFVIDLFDQIDRAYLGLESIFDKIKEDDFIIAFFPCICFEDQKLLVYRGDSFSMRKN